MPHILSESHVHALVYPTQLLQPLRRICVHLDKLFRILLLILSQRHQSLVVVDGTIHMETCAIRVETRAVKAIKICLLLGFEETVVTDHQRARDFETPLEKEPEDPHNFIPSCYYFLS